MAKRTKNWKPKLRRHSSGQARCVLPGSSKVYYLGPYGTQQAEDAYEDLIRRWRANGKRPLDPVDTVDVVQKRIERLAERLDVSLEAAQQPVEKRRADEPPRPRRT